MPDIARIVEVLDNVLAQLDTIKYELGQLQNQNALTGVGMGLAPGLPTSSSPVAVIPPTAPDSVDEIVGGSQTGEFPDCCAVGTDHRYCCSGTLIAPTVVVTADHCENITRVFLMGNNIEEPHAGETIRVINQFSHPEVDLKVLVLERASQVQPRHVAQGAEVYAAETAMLAGFGTIDLHGTIGYGLKRKVEVPIKSLGCGAATDAKQYGCLPNRELVAGHRGLQRDSCQGDSGGPLYIKSYAGDYYLLGATSRGARGGFTSCGDGGIYVRVDLCLGWIRTVTGVEIEDALT